MTFWIPWAIDVATAGVFVYFFIVGLGDGSVSSFNIALWALILCGLAGVLGGSVALRSAGQTAWATVLVGLVAIPSVLIGLFFLVIIVAPVRWN